MLSSTPGGSTSSAGNLPGESKADTAQQNALSGPEKKLQKSMKKARPPRGPWRPRPIYAACIGEQSYASYPCHP